MMRYRIAFLVICLTVAGTAAAIRGDLPHPLGGAAMASDGDLVFVFGGSTSAAGDLTDEIRLLRADGTSEVVARLPSPRGGVGATFADGRYVVAGGGTAGGGFLDEVVAFDPGTSEVRVVGRLPAAVASPALATLDGVAYVIGGFTECTSACPVATTQIVSVSRAGAIAVERAALPEPRAAMTALAKDGTIYLVGGVVSARGSEPSDDVWAFRPDEDAVVPFATDRVDRNGPGAFLHGRSIYVFGGLDEGFQFRTDWTRIDLTSATVAEAPGTPTIERHAFSTALSGDLGYIVGGAGCGGLQSMCSDFVTVQFSDAGPVLDPSPTASSEEPRRVAMPAGMALAAIAISLWIRRR